MREKSPNKIADVNEGTNVVSFGFANDVAILNGIREGHSGAFRALYDRYVDRVYRLAWQHFQNDSDAQNASQEVFLLIFRKIHGFRGDAELGTWIYRLTCNACLNELKRRKRRNLLHGLWRQKLENDTIPEKIQASALAREEISRVMDTVSSMDQRKRVTFHLYYVEELTADEVAIALEEKKATVLKRLQRIRNQLIEQATREDQNSDLTDQKQVGWT